MYSDSHFEGKCDLLFRIKFVFLFFVFFQNKSLLSELFLLGSDLVSEYKVSITADGRETRALMTTRIDDRHIAKSRNLLEGPIIAMVRWCDGVPKYL